MAVTDMNVNSVTHYDYYNGAVPEREEQAAGDWKLSEADKPPSRVVDSTVQKFNTKGPSARASTTKYSTAMNVEIKEKPSKNNIHTLPDVIRIKCCEGGGSQDKILVSSYHT